MPSLASVSAPISTEILIVGAGVLGLCTAVELKRRGHALVVLDPGGRNASSVAAGMIAPALEAALDEATPDRAALFREARAVWDGFGVALEPGPAVWRGVGADGVADRLSALGFSVERDGDDVLAPDDVRVEPEAVMAAWRRELGESLIAASAHRIERMGDGWKVSAGGQTIKAGVVVLAGGAAPPPARTPDAITRMLAAIEPVRGQIGWTAKRLSDRVVRGEGAYVVPSAGGTLIGATMEPGRLDLKPDAATGAQLLAAAARLVGRDLSSLEIDWRVGIRGAAPDGLPMAGPSGETDLHLAVAPRRNGWLLGPLVARVVADGIEDAAASPQAAALDPRRFL